MKLSTDKKYLGLITRDFDTQNSENHYLQSTGHKSLRQFLKLSTSVRYLVASLGLDTLDASMTTSQCDNQKFSPDIVKCCLEAKSAPVKNYCSKS